MYKPSEFIAAPSPIIVTLETLSDVIDSLDINIRCRILLLGSFRYFFLKVRRLTIVTKAEFDLIQKAWPTFSINNEEYRFFKDGDFLGIQKVPRELLVFKKQKVKVFTILNSLLVKTGPMVPKLAYQALNST